MEVLPESTLDMLRGVPFTEEQAREIFAPGEEVVVFVLLELSKRLAEQQGKTAAESHQAAGTPSNCTRNWSPFPPETRELQFVEKWAFVGKKEKHCDPDDPEDQQQGTIGITWATIRSTG